MDFDPTPFYLTYGLVYWVQLVAVISVACLVLGLLLSFSAAGARGGAVFASGLKSFFSDLFSISPRRVIALAGLTLKEAMRRKALLVFVVFAVLLMFAGWFLTDSNNRADLQVHVHITFMLTTISWLILPVVMFLSCWGIPEDIRIRSLHTVVTKPARRVEVVLGRMLGFSSMATVILVLMGVIGYIWIQRQVPESAKKRLTCRVPVYGSLFFLDREGLPKRTGINVGDPWLYRSFVEGNTRQRAIWVFPGVTPENLGDELKIESRFEAFRTVKGTEDSIEGGIEAQYSLVNDPREEAFASFGAAVSFRPAAEAMRAGDFLNAAEEWESLAERISTDPKDFPVIEMRHISIASELAAVIVKSVGGDFEEVVQAFESLRAAAVDANPENTKSYEAIAQCCQTLSEVLSERGLDLAESMPRIHVPLESFRISEYHEGDDYQTFPRELVYPADYESQARFLANTISDLNEQGRVAEGSGLSASLVDTLTDDFDIAPVNAELLVDVLNEEIESGTLETSDGKLATADESRWLQYFDKLVQEEKLISQDPAGWLLKADLFEDLAPNERLRVEVACLNDQMYLGMARADMFIRLPDNSFLSGFTKSLLSIGLMLALVVVIGVTASCVVKGPVAFFFTLTVFVIGQFFHTLMQRLIAGVVEGGGLLESAVLIVQHRNPSTGMDATEGTQQLVQTFDAGTTFFLRIMSGIIPDFGVFSGASAYVENGFDVPWASSVLPALATFFGFLIPCVLIGAACLKFRELEAK